MLYKHFTETNDSLTLSLVFNTSFIFIFRFTPTIDIEPKNTRIARHFNWKYKKHLTTYVIKCLDGADDGARTRYLHLGKVALYQMSYIRIFIY